MTGEAGERWTGVTAFDASAPPNVPAAGATLARLSATGKLDVGFPDPVGAAAVLTGAGAVFGGPALPPLAVAPALGATIARPGIPCAIRAIVPAAAP